MKKTKTKSVGRTFVIIEELSKSGPMSVSELSEVLDIPVSTVHDYLQSLVQKGYVAREDKQYRTTTKFLEIGYQQLHRSKIYKAAEPELDALAEQTGEHVTLMTEENGEGALLAVREGKKAVSVRSYPGARMPLHATAPGKAILAHMPSERIDDIIDSRGLPSLTKHTITDPERLREELTEIREQGYAVDEGERITGMVLVSAPILDRNERIRAAVCVAGPRNRFDEQRQQEVSSLVKEVANVIQVQIDYA